jgi:hypothetical protein
MAKCWGWVRKEGRRCGREAGHKLFCDSHRTLIRTFAVGAAVAIFLNYVAAQIPPLWSSSPDPQFTTADFQLRLEVWAWPNSFNANFVKPELIRVVARIGPVLIKSDMEPAPKPIHPPTGRGNVWTTHTYQNKTTYIENLASLKRVQNLVGQTLLVTVPYELFSYAQDSRVKYVLEFYIRGEKIKVEANQRGLFEGPITKDMLGGA